MRWTRDCVMHEDSISKTRSSLWCLCHVYICCVKFNDIDFQKLGWLNLNIFSAARMYSPSRFIHGCSLSGKVRHGKDSGICYIHTPANSRVHRRCKSHSTYTMLFYQFSLKVRRSPATNLRIHKTVFFTNFTKINWSAINDCCSNNPL